MIMPIVVAEIGINHNGDVGIAKSLMALAKNFGAKFVKFQKRTVDVVYSKEALAKPRVSKWGTTTRDQKLGLEFEKAQYDEIDDYSKEIGIPWFASPWDPKSVEFLAKYKPPFMKVASAVLTDMETLSAIRQTGISTIVSIGMSSKEEIDRAVDLLGNQIKYMLHCVSTYPTADEDMNMLRVAELDAHYGGKFAVGFSNHSPKIIYLVQAFIMGARMLEFHITLDRNMEGSDQAASIGPIGFERIMSHLRSVVAGYGYGEIGCSKSEEEVKKKLRRFI